tara:strand:- start:128 stop:1474 length:1347 start_codon:yes stop_codon:yes gene_type:complete
MLIKGRFFLDLNTNGLKSNNEPLISNLKVSSDCSNFVTYSDPNGQFLYLISESCEIIAELPNYYSFYGDSVYKSFQYFYTGQEKEYDIPIHIAGRNIGVSAISGFLRPGFHGQLTINVNSTSNDTLYKVRGGANILDKNVVQFVSNQNVGVTWVSSDSVSFIIDTLLPNENYQIYTKVVIEQGEEHLGRNVCFVLTLDELDNEITSSDNTFNLCREITGSYDPNHKEATIGNGEIPKDNRTLTYVVQFQNTGTDTAFNITIIDTLDESLFDLNSLRLLNGSYPYSFILENNVGKWSFNNIHLVDSFTNEPLSHGSFLFEISLKGSVENNQKISNFVDIYFDYNKPVRTNTAVNYFLPEKLEANRDVTDLEIYPNPVDEYLRFSFQNSSSGEIIASLFNSKGALIKFVKFECEEGFNNRLIKLPLLATGSYLLKVGDSKGVSFLKKYNF